ncbi:hypothetical protein HORIV_21550 [Vreelandella olivaria]|uniref:YeeE/YedE family protein n=1 Tax=Vreelandella olivaria TaxID=390919 RepID=A0ABM7GGJ4_9GAMM|nr:hypothetical protein HORIV_21550 [Halomonas olivaria]
MNSSINESDKRRWLKTAAGYAAGLLFGLGLAVSGMTDPARVVGFLDVVGAWDPTLMFVLGGAVITTFIGYRLVLKRPAPLLGGVFQLPTKRELDAKLLGALPCLASAGGFLATAQGQRLPLLAVFRYRCWPCW